MLIDTHCHLEKDEYENVDEIIKKSMEKDIEYLIVSGYDLNSNKEVIELINKYQNIYGSIGYAPSETGHVKEDDYQLLEKMINDSKIVAIGEIGLDYHWNDDFDRQKALFERQLLIAEQNDMPVIIHNRDANDDICEILSKYKLKGIIHCFNGSLELAQKFINMGFLLGIGGLITFKNSEELREVIKQVPLEYITLETDSPYLTPEPHRGKKNDPSYLSYIAYKVADIKKISYNEVCKETLSNAIRLFDL